MDADLREIVLLLIRLARLQQEKRLQLAARVDALHMLLARATGTPLDAADETVDKITAQLRANESGKEENQQVDAIVALLTKGKNPDIQDA